MRSLAHKITATTDRRALLAWALAVIFVGSFASDLFHYALTPHAVCFEHGDIVHEGARPLSLQVGGAVRSIEAPPADPSEHLHDRCLILSPSVGASLSLPLCVAPRGLQLASSGLSLADELRRARLDLYLLAPKNSPPARA